MDIWMISALALATLIGFVVSAAAGKWLIPWLHRLHFGQTIREIGPKWHQKKQGTPTMGGLLFALGSGAALLLMVPVCLALAGTHPSVKLFVNNNTIVRFVAGLLLMAGCGAIGFVDDYIKVVKKRNLGLTSGQKLALQILVAACYIASLYLCGDHVMEIPFCGTVELGWWFFPLGIFIVVGATNAVNLTDGIDGLCGSVSFLALLPLLVLAGYLGVFAEGLTAAALAGGVLGFLAWNLHPARVFMGDLGSLFLGGALCAVAFGIQRPLLLIPIGVVYIVETLSVILQVTYFKLTHGKRLFKMSPIHHHFELCGWSENTIVAAAAGLTLLGGIGALALELFA